MLQQSVWYWYICILTFIVTYKKKKKELRSNILKSQIISTIAILSSVRHWRKHKDLQSANATSKIQLWHWFSMEHKTKDFTHDFSKKVCCIFTTTVIVFNMEYGHMRFVLFRLLCRRGNTYKRNFINYFDTKPFSMQNINNRLYFYG